MSRENVINDLLRFGRTIRYLGSRQILIRARRIQRQLWWRAVKKHAPLPADFEIASCNPLFSGLSDVKKISHLEDVKGAVTRAAHIRKLKFSFLNKTIQFEDRPHWHDQNLSHLWRYHLHYFDFITDLLTDYYISDDVSNYRAFKEIALSWIKKNSILSGDGWHPYTISARVVNWLNALSGFNGLISNDNKFRELYFSSLYGQLRVLNDDLEHDVRGNHLIKNLRALIFGSSAFAGKEPEGWYENAINVLHSEVREQVLNDGGHFERNPGYHLAVLTDLLETAIWVKINRKISYPWLDKCLHRMLEWLIEVALPENRLPLLKDTTWDNRTTIEDILAVGALYFESSDYKLYEEFGLYPFLLFGNKGKDKFEKWEKRNRQGKPVALRDSGYYLMREAGGNDFLIFDAGKACPDYLPAHAHADMLSYELTIGDKRIVVDSGVYEYTAGKWRDYFRSTRAHNTVEVSGRNQSDVWSSFRVADRAYPKKVEWKRDEDHALVQCRHDGYKKLPVKATHKRSVMWQKGRFWLILDCISGIGKTEGISHIHLHPDIFLKQKEDSLWEVGGGAGRIWLKAFGHTSDSINSGQTKPFCQGWYSEKFGKKVPNTVLSLHSDKKMPYYFGYIISKEDPVVVDLKACQGNTIEINVVHRMKEFTYNFR